MAKINVSAEIERLKDICETGNLKSIIFTFIYQDVDYKCFYCYGGDVITIAPEGYSIGLNLPIEDNELDNYFGDDNYNKLKEIHLTLSTAIFCNKMLEKIKRLTLNEVQPITNVDISILCRKVIKNDKDKKIFFLTWSRHFSGAKTSEDNLNKTLVSFGKEIHVICKENNISSRWKSTPTKKSLNFLDRENSKKEIIDLI